jgi:hypothetical protein
MAANICSAVISPNGKLHCISLPLMNCFPFPEVVYASSLVLTVAELVQRDLIGLDSTCMLG